jgi:hypothetical protein
MVLERFLLLIVNQSIFLYLSTFVIPAKAGIQKETGFRIPRSQSRAGKCGMTERGWIPTGVYPREIKGGNDRKVSL